MPRGFQHCLQFGNGHGLAHHRVASQAECGCGGPAQPCPVHAVPPTHRVGHAGQVIGVQSQLRHSCASVHPAHKRHEQENDGKQVVAAAPRPGQRRLRGSQGRSSGNEGKRNGGMRLVGLACPGSLEAAAVWHLREAAVKRGVQLH